jgi:hypothetical protein
MRGAVRCAAASSLASHAFMTLSPASSHVPRLRYRLTQEDDLPECLALIPEWLALGPAVTAALPGLWASMYRWPMVLTMVMEDLALPRGQRIQAWGVGLLLGPAEVAQLKLDALPPPGVARRTYEALLDGRLPELDDATLGRHNARGEISGLSLHFCSRPLQFEQAATQALITIANDSFRASMCGYQLRAQYFENHVQTEPFMATAGFQRRPRPPEQEASGLQWWGMTRDEARAILPGSTVRALFDAHPPRFRLSLSQRRMLWMALFYEDDEQLAQQLQLSSHGLKKLWRGVYERIQDGVPDFFGDDLGADEEGKRGPEKRRQVLAYVRQRPEELRPWNPSAP